MKKFFALLIVVSVVAFSTFAHASEKAVTKNTQIVSSVRKLLKPYLPSK